MSVEMTADVAARMIRTTPDPLAPSTDHRKLSCKKVYDVSEPDHDGLVEVLYIDSEDEPMTAYFRGKKMIFTAVGW